MTPDVLRVRYEAGATIEELVSESALSFRTVRNALLGSGVVLRPPMRRIVPCPPGMVAAYQRGDSLNTLAERYGLSYSVTRRRLLEAGVTLRPPGAAPAR